MSDEYLRLNALHWDDRAPAHAASPDYQVDRFAAEPAHLSDVVRFDLPRLGVISGLRGLHLQCHIGTDTVSLARLGARMTGLDFSSASIAQARRIAALADAEIDFVEADVYSATQVIAPGGFDLVYTGIGALCWLPSITRWADVVVALLAPGGRLFLREAHPTLWSLDEERSDALVIDYPYFERTEPLDFADEGSYVEVDRSFEHNRTLEWTHGVGEILTALLNRGLTITGYEEHDSVPWDALPGQMERIGGGEFRLRDRPWRLPHTYTLQAVKPR